MSFQDLVEEAKLDFPKLDIKYKNESLFMKIIGKILFFNKDFMTSYTTTIGNAVYYPSNTFTKSRPISSIIVLLHELVHIYDANKLSLPLFGCLYLFPQILVLLALPLLFIKWKLFLFSLLLILPIPAYFRMNFEKRAYLVSLYSLYRLSNKLNFNINLDEQNETFLKNFKNKNYYWMWPFSGLDKEFDLATEKIKSGQTPYKDNVFEKIDNLIEKV